MRFYLPVPAEDLCETPDFVKGVVERCRRDANRVRLAKIALHIRGDEFFV
jgi:hypothetical protein